MDDCTFSNILKAEAEAKAKAAAEARETQTKATTHGLKTNTIHWITIHGTDGGDGY